MFWFVKIILLFSPKYFTLRATSLFLPKTRKLQKFVGKIMTRTLTKLKHFVCGAALLSGVAATTTNARAVPLSSAAGVSLVGTTNAARPELAGTVLIDRVRPFSMTTTSGTIISGTFQDRVVKRTSTGKLEFSFRIKNDAASVGNIVVVNRQNYGAYPTVDVDYRTDGLGTIGALAASHGGGASARIKFDFFNAPITPGGESRFHFIGTTATGYDESGQVSLQSSNGGYTTFKVFTPKASKFIAVIPPILFKIKQPNLKTSLALSGADAALAGEDISNRIKVYAMNNGSAAAAGTTGTLSPANGFMIDVMLSKDNASPASFAIYSPNYSDDVLLLGGRISNTTDLGAGNSGSYATGATIPADTPPGTYFLSLRIDPANKVGESNEDDNTFFLPIKITRRYAVPID